MLTARPSFREIITIVLTAHLDFSSHQASACWQRQRSSAQESDGLRNVLVDNVAKLRQAFEVAASEFIPENGCGAGVRVRRRQ